jgi:acyl phosphate:glycerol-3-phosphate acyltransferase
MILLRFVAIAIAFLSGAVPYGLLVCRTQGIDLREVGSGNIGATNAARALGKRFGLIILALDVLKGFVPVFLIRLWLDADPQRDLFVGGAMVAAVLGHMFTPFLRFRGGKGVATGLGVILAANPIAGACGLVIYIGVYAVTHISSLGSLVGTASAPVIMLLFSTPPPIIAAGGVICLFIIIKHKANIARLIKGEEGKV